MTEADKWDLITAYVTGNADEAQQARIDQLDAADKKEIERIQQAYQQDQAIAIPFDLARGETLMHSKLSGAAVKDIPDEDTVTTPIVRKPWKWMLATAAASVILIGMAIWFSGKNIPGTPIEYLTVTATRGADRQKILLEDSSIIYINGKTRIRYPKIFGKTERKIFLEGDAFFEVRKDPTRPFVVESGGIHTVVLGTSFRIRSGTDQSLEVMVATGKVAVKKDSTLLSLLTPGNGLRYDSLSGRYSTRSYPQEEIYGISKQALVFKQTPMPTVMRELEKWFGVTIVFDHPMQEYGSINGSFSNFSLEDVLRSIALSSDIRYQRSGDTIHIKSKL